MLQSRAIKSCFYANVLMHKRSFLLYYECYIFWISDYYIFQRLFEDRLSCIQDLLRVKFFLREGRS